MPTAAQIDKMDASSAEASARSFGVVSDSSVKWFVNGVATAGDVAKRIIADSIAAVEVNKVEGGSRIYITTKDAVRTNAAADLGLRPRIGARDDTLVTTLKSASVGSNGTTPILIVDDVRKDMATLKTLDRARIATVNILKGASAVSEYGPDAKNGVIVVRMKPAGTQ